MGNILIALFSCVRGRRLNNFWVADLCSISGIISSTHTSKGAVCIHVGFCLLVLNQMGE